MAEKAPLARPLAYTVAVSPTCLFPQAAQRHLPVPPLDASKWMPIDLSRVLVAKNRREAVVKENKRTAPWTRKATLAKHHGCKENLQPQEFAAERGIYQASASLGTPALRQRGERDPAAPPRWRSANAGSKNLRPAASDPIGSPAEPTAPRKPPAAAWEELVESCRRWCAELTL
ncbi:hypothetical protein T484DRAFT_1845277 [Baffinella frigidus]|nr:hypothetical protein T484DRAFT_1845277 [Cryptophyta sp. CCMP2293]